MQVYIAYGAGIVLAIGCILLVENIEKRRVSDI